MKPAVFIHTNDKQLLGAMVGRHLLKRNSARPVVAFGCPHHPLGRFSVP